MKKFYFLLIAGGIFLSGFSPNPVSDPSFSVAPELVNSYKTKIVKDVFNRLKMAKGDFRSRRPYLRFVKSNPSGPASAFSKKGLIVLEEKGYDVCLQFGKDSLNALAIFLAHELVHCYEKHDWELHFASQFAKDSELSTVSDDAKDDEVQADYLGGFLTYQAGFETFGIMPDFLTKVYKAYNLKDEEMSNYPPVKERAKMAEKSEEKLKKLIKIFEVGNFLTAVDEYEEAIDYYHKILEDFQSREIYNNVGVVSTLSAMNLFSPTELGHFHFPIELDLNSRMTGGGKGFEIQFREEQLLEAIDFFAKARQLDPFYPIAYLNEGCARALLGISQKDFSDLEWADAESLALRAIRLAEMNPEFSGTATDAKVLLGILAALKEEKTEANQFFEKVLEIAPNHFLAKNNLAILNGKAVYSTADFEEISGEELIDDLQFGKIKMGRKDIKDTVRLDLDTKVRLASQRKNGSSVFANVSQRGTGGTKVKKFTLFQLTDRDYSGTSGKGIRIGDSAGTVLGKYGQPAANLSLGEGAFLRYNLPEEKGLIFQIGADARVKRWCVFSKS